MCGIAGILNLNEPKPIDEELLTNMLAAIRHRGPDESGVYIDPWIGMGNVRLSIIGLAGGTQPLGNEDGSIWIVYNGEAFNYIELKEDLIKCGHKFTTQTDTEVILHLYEEFGPGCLEKINGQFAIAIWDTKKRELFLARDRVGIRPLFYSCLGNQFIFASEIKSIFMCSDVPRAIDTKSLLQVYTFWTTITPRTIFEQIHELAPGHYMVVKDGAIRQKAYWSIPYYTPEGRWRGNIDDAQNRLKELLLDAVRLRLRADVPVGAYASGGLDSSITSALISKHFNNRLKTFSIGFESSRFDESDYQNDLVNNLGTEHFRILVDNENIRDHLADVIWHCEKPILRTAPVPLFLLSKLVRDSSFKVVLTGEGADEVFGGYNIYKEAKVRAFWGKHPESFLRPLLLEKLYPYIFKNPSRTRAIFQKFYSVTSADLTDPFFSHRIRWSNTSKNLIFLADEVLARENGYCAIDEAAARLPLDFDSRDVLSKAQFLEMDIFLSNYLLSSQGDRPAMAHSLEIRLPFLDYRVIDFAARLPAKWKINGLNEKYILKNAFKGLIPDSIRNRPKQPYRAPIREVFFGDTSNEFLDFMLSEDCLKKVGLFNEKKVGRLLAKYQKGTLAVESEVQNMALVGILSTQIVHYQFIDHFPWKSIQPLKLDKIIRNNS